jgi:hypothetical protein
VGPARRRCRRRTLLEESLQARTCRSPAVRRAGGPAGAQELAVDRREVGLVGAMSAAGRDAGQLVVHGEPGAWKSATALAAIDEIRNAGGVVVALSLRDLAPEMTGAAAGQAPRQAAAHRRSRFRLQPRRPRIRRSRRDLPDVPWRTFFEQSRYLFGAARCRWPRPLTRGPASEEARRLRCRCAAGRVDGPDDVPNPQGTATVGL